MPDNVFTDYAFTKAGGKIVAAELEEDVWDFLKASYTVGDFTMPCCPSAAIPKTSINGLHFFASSVRRVHECSRIEMAC